MHFLCVARTFRLVAALPEPGMGNVVGRRCFARDGLAHTPSHGVHHGITPAEELVNHQPCAVASTDAEWISPDTRSLLARRRDAYPFRNNWTTVGTYWSEAQPAARLSDETHSEARGLRSVYCRSLGIAIPAHQCNGKSRRPSPVDRASLICRTANRLFPD